MKVLLVVVLIAGIFGAQGQLNLDLGLGLGLSVGRTGPPPPDFFYNVILRSEAQKVLATPNLPADLQQRVQDILESAELGFNSCSTVSTLPWFQMRCVALQLSISKGELKAIEDEAKARSQVAATTEGSGQALVEATNA